MKKKRTLAAVCFLLAVCLAITAGCGKGKDKAASDGDAADSTVSDNAAGDGGATVGVENSGSGDGDDGAAGAAFSYSAGIDENGFWEGIRALDHVEIFDYHAMEFPPDSYQISDDEMQSEIDAMLASFASGEQVTDRPVANGDTVNIDYVGSIGGVPFDNGSTEEMGTDVTIGVTEYIDDFLEQLIGHMPGETVNVNVTFPANYHAEDLQGKDALFVTVINYIVVTVTPEISDAFVEENLFPYYGWSTVSDVEEGIRSEFKTMGMQQYIQYYFIEEVTVHSVPEQIIEYQEKYMLNYYLRYASYSGMGLDDYLLYYEGISSVEELIEVTRDINTTSAVFYLVIQAIAEDAGFSVTEADLADYFLSNAGTSDYSMEEEEYGLPFLKQNLLCNMVLDYILDNAVLT